MLKNIQCYSNDVSMKLFADDSKLYSNEPHVLQDALDSTIAWTQNRQLRVASQKYFQMSLSKRPSVSSNHSTFTINDTQLETKTSVTDLGVIISDNMKWEQHVDSVYRKASQKCYQIMKCFKSRNIWVLIDLYKTYVRPKVEFNSSVWSPYLKKDIARIESVQRTYTRFAFLRCGLAFTSYNDRLRQINLRSLEERRLIIDLILLFKIIYQINDLKFSDFFVFKPVNHNLRRNSMQIASLKTHNSDQWRNLFFTRITHIWKALPEEAVTATSVNLFKSRIKKLDLSKFVHLSYNN